MHASAYLFQSRDGVYYARFVVPAQLRTPVESREFRISTLTKDPRDAELQFFQTRHMAGLEKIMALRSETLEVIVLYQSQSDHQLCWVLKQVQGTCSVSLSYRQLERLLVNFDQLRTPFQRLLC